MNDRFGFRVKIKGDNKVREVLDIDFQNLRIAVDISGIREWRSFDKIEELMQSTGLRDKSDYCKLVYEYDIINIDGYIIGNYYENEDLLKEKTNLLIKRFGEKNWYATYKEAMDRGCKYS